MIRTFKIVTAPLSEPVTASDVKLYSRVSSSVEDSLINTWITSGRLQAEWYQHRAYITQTIELYYDRWPTSNIINLPRCPLITVNSIKYYDEDGTENTFDASNYEVDTSSEPGRIALAPNVIWPTTLLRSLNGVVINYDAGFGAADDVPSNIKEAIYLYCAFGYENRIAEDGTAPESFYHKLQPDRIEDR